VDQVGHWSPARWRQQVDPPGPTTRADVIFALVQELADAGADAEGRPRRPVPRLDNDLALVDQIRVMVADLGASGLPSGPVPPNVQGHADAQGHVDAQRYVDGQGQVESGHRLAALVLDTVRRVVSP
jgi:hypothetical protein